MEPKYNYIVCTHCFTFNHAAFIKKTLDGFTMQKTTFPTVFCVVDDASTDGEQIVIRNYLNANFKMQNARQWETDDACFIEACHKENQNCWFVVVLLKYNFRQTRKSKIALLTECPLSSKYVALCEGDDYWIDPNKLQKQVDFLESHPDYSMCCNRTKLYSDRRQKTIGENYCYNESRDINSKDIINRTGLFISTCSILYRKKVKDNYPDYCRRCAVGDYPLQIMCAMKGKTYYFNEIMSVYRVENSNSWMGQQKWTSTSDNNLKRIKSMVLMFKGFAEDYPKYKAVFNNKIAQYLNVSCPSATHNPAANKCYFDAFSDYTDNYSWLWKIDFFLRTHADIFSRAYRFIIAPTLLKKYKQKKLIYK